MKHSEICRRIGGLALRQGDDYVQVVAIISPTTLVVALITQKKPNILFGLMVRMRGLEPPWFPARS